MVETKVFDFSLVSKAMHVKHATLVVVYSVNVMIAGHVLGFENNTSMKGLNPTVQRFAICVLYRIKYPCHWHWCPLDRSHVKISIDVKL